MMKSQSYHASVCENRPKQISVIVPIYKVERYLERCVESILNQSYTALEIILVDDGSPDGCGEMCDRFAESDHRIKVLHKENGGLSEARNRGMEAATGELLLFVDGDDYLQPDCCAAAAEALENAQADICVFGYYEVFGEKKQVCLLPVENGAVLDARDSLDLLVSGKQKHVAWNKLCRREVFRNVKYPVGRKWEDVGTTCKVVGNAERIVYIQKQLYNYIQREDSISARRKPKDLRDIWAMYREQDLYCKEHFPELEEKAKKKMLHAMCNAACNDVSDAEGTADLAELHQWLKEVKLLSASVPYKEKALLLELKLSKELFSGAYRLWAGPVRKIYAKLLWEKRMAPLAVDYLKHKKDRFGLSSSAYKNEYYKYRKNLLAEKKRDFVFAQMKGFLRDELILYSDHLTLSDDPCIPTVVVVVKDDLDRMMLFYDHYRRLGIRQFIVLDNNSSDGTLEFVSAQEGTRTYRVTVPFQTQRKEAWCEKLLALTGYDRWYILVDSDELLDYVGSETHSAEALIRHMHQQGFRRIWGMLLDMYAEGPLFSVDCGPMEIPQKCCWFDSDSYRLNLKDSPNSIRGGDEVYGGPRYRLFGSIQTISKQAIFYFSENTFYRNCHFLYPAIHWGDVPFCYVLRHYKFLKKDEKAYRERVQKGNFYNNSVEYARIMGQAQQGEMPSMLYKNSVLYTGPESLKVLPYLSEIEWN